MDGARLLNDKEPDASITRGLQIDRRIDPGYDCFQLDLDIAFFDQGSGLESPESDPAENHRPIKAHKKVIAAEAAIRRGKEIGIAAKDELRGVSPKLCMTLEFCFER